MPLYLEQLETPAPVVDLDRLALNLDRMAAYCAMHGLALRPHVKTHKAPRIAAEQLRLGAVGLTCATVREAEVMAELSSDLLLAYPVTSLISLRRLTNLPPSIKLTVGLDSARAAGQLALAADEIGRTVDVLVEVDVGMHRTGVQGPEAAVELATWLVDRSPPLHYAGIMFYPGHVRQRAGEQAAPMHEVSRAVERTLEALAAAGLAAQTVSGGSTPAAWRMHEVPGLTEVRPGTYVYNDRVTAAIGACEWDECAFSVLATVVSTAVSGQAVIDAGSKALGREPMDGVRVVGADESDVPGGRTDGFGALLDRPEVVVARMSEEHGILDLSRTEWRPEVGEQVRVVPNHVCYVVALNDVVYGLRDEVVETRWPVAARGRVAPEQVPAW